MRAYTVVERSFTRATSPSTRLSLLPSHPAAIMYGAHKVRACGRKGVQNRDSSRASLTLCHVIRHCRQLQGKRGNN